MISNGINICFFGINRSLSLTHNSIKTKLIDKLQAIFDPRQIVISSCLNRPALGKITSPRSGEADSPEDSHPYLSEVSDFYKENNQEEFDRWFDYQAILNFGDFFSDATLINSNNQIARGPKGSLVNIARALYALKSSYEMFPEERKKFPTIFVRPDLDIIDNIDIHFYLNLLNASDDIIIVPTWHSWGGINDRLAICSGGKSSSTYANRFDAVHMYLELSQRPLHPETFLYDIMRLKHIHILPIIDSKLVRVRSCGDPYFNDAVSKDDFEYLQSESKTWNLLLEKLHLMNDQIQELKSAKLYIWRSFKRKLCSITNLRIKFFRKPSN